MRVGVLEECIYCDTPTIFFMCVVSVPLDFSGHPAWCGGIKSLTGTTFLVLSVPPARLAMVQNG